MKKKQYKVLIFTGTMLLLAALFLALYNFRQNSESGKNTQKILSVIQNEISENPITTEPDESYYKPTSNLYDDYENSIDITEDVEQILEVDGKNYIGFVSIPNLNIELPVMDEWSNDNLRISPCRYYGKASSKDMIIAAHNYTSHFGNISLLNTGDAILFTDVSGKVYTYEVIQSDTVGGNDIEQMKSGAGTDWNLTLFTCTLSGSSRVSVRAVIIE